MKKLLMVFAAILLLVVMACSSGDDVNTNTSHRPNLTPYQDDGWSDKIVVSTKIGDHVDATILTSDDNLYVDWAYINNGTADITQDYNVKLYLDDVLNNTWPGCNPLLATNMCFISDYSLGKLSVGTHKIKMVVDADNQITESNENDNEYTKTITVTAPGTYSMKGTIYNAYTSQLPYNAAIQYPTTKGGVYEATVSIADKTTTTDENGAFSITGIPAGTHILSVSRLGYVTYIDNAYKINSDASSLSFFLDMAPPFGILAACPYCETGGISWNYQTIEGAETAALQACGQSSCVIIGGFGKGSCAAYASGNSGWGSAADYLNLNQAETEAVNACNSSTTGCVLKLSECNSQ